MKIVSYPKVSTLLIASERTLEFRHLTPLNNHCEDSSYIASSSVSPHPRKHSNRTLLANSRDSSSPCPVSSPQLSPTVKAQSS